MKNQLLLVAFLVIAGSRLAAQSSVNRVGGNLSYGTEDINFGLGARAEFRLAEKLILSPKFNYYFGTSETFSGVTVEAGGYTLDGDFHYYIVSGPVSFYALAGLSYANVKASVAGQGFSASASDSKAGVNAGVGVLFNPQNKIIPFLEIKYNSPFEALLFNAGVLFPIGK